MLRTSLLLVVLLGIAPVHAVEHLGKIDFPTTGSPAAHEHFLRGVMALHSFWYDEALREFRAATAAEPTYAMGYWGEAMASNHTVWGFLDLDGGRKALAKVPAAREALTEKERAFLAAVALLYVDGGDDRSHVNSYAAAMERMHATWPEDDEIAAFYSLALLGTIRPGDPGVATRMKAGALALEILSRNPDHPGAAHYAIHSFDDPIHAILAMPAARRYAKIAPEAFHARHMPAHIFVQLGMWDEAIAACESAWAASRAVATAQGKKSGDLHSQSWLVDMYAQEGQVAKAEDALRVFASMLEERPEARIVYEETVFAFVRELGAWGRLDELLAPGVRAAEAERAQQKAEAEAPSCHATPKNSGHPENKLFELADLAFIHAVAAARRGDAKEVARRKDELRGLGKKLATTDLASYAADQLNLDDLRLAALLAIHDHDLAVAATKLRGAIVVSEKLDGPYPFASPLAIPLEEELGDVLTAMNKPKDALDAFQAALRKRPGRTHSLLGAARAAAKLGDRTTAGTFYSQARSNLAQADAGFADAAEAQAWR